MKYFVEQAETHREAEERVRSKYGDRARIMHHRSVRLGGFLGLFTREGVEVTGYFAADSKRKATAAQVSADPAAQQSLDEEKRKLIELARGGDQTLDTVLSEIRSLRDAVRLPASDVHPAIAEVRSKLELNDFSPSYIRRIEDRMRRELSVEQLEDSALVQNSVLEWIGESIRIHEPRKGGSPEIFILVGPTGVGKTTTIAKLAAMYGLERGTRKRDIRVLTIDNYRIGARQQIETYGQIMDIAVSFVESADDMKKYLALYQDADMIFVDTIGKSPRDFRKLGEMNELLSACGGRARVHLAISATTKTADVAEIATQFEPFKYEAVVITKLDETSRMGNVIGVLAERDKPISFITDGQRVPQDIERATVMRLLRNLEGFDVPRAALEQRFTVA
ncbi:MAG: flagellar biosynthesis protein FlhF [Spirochaetaceae bacterium]|nr:MAG: flagellar biosynthesis protein FlhF [Spirochaetaceae bacterium]